MAKEKEQKKEIVLERVYNVPLRIGFIKVQRYKRTKKAMKTLREFLMKHMKSEDVRIGNYLNRKLWQHGIKNPPHHVKVNVKKDSEGVVYAEFVGAPAPKEEPKKEAKKEHAPEKKEVKAEKAHEVKAAPAAKEVKKPAPKKEATKPKLGEKAAVEQALDE